MPAMCYLPIAARIRPLPELPMAWIPRTVCLPGRKSAVMTPMAMTPVTKVFAISISASNSGTQNTGHGVTGRADSLHCLTGWEEYRGDDSDGDDALHENLGNFHHVFLTL